MTRIEQMENGRRVLVIKFQLAASKKKKKTLVFGSRLSTVFGSVHTVWYGNPLVFLFSPQ